MGYRFVSGFCLKLLALFSSYWAAKRPPIPRWRPPTELRPTPASVFKCQNWTSTFPGMFTRFGDGSFPASGPIEFRTIYYVLRSDSEPRTLLLIVSNVLFTLGWCETSTSSDCDLRRLMYVCRNEQRRPKTLTLGWGNNNKVTGQLRGIVDVVFIGA